MEYIPADFQLFTYFLLFFFFIFKTAMILSGISTNFYKYKRKLTYLRTFATQLDNNELKVLFFGTDNFSLPSLKVLHKHNRLVP